MSFQFLSSLPWARVIFTPSMLTFIGIALAVLLFTICNALFFTPSVIVCARGEGIQCTPENPRFRDTSLPIPERVEDLMSYMTLEEKVGQLALVEKNSIRNVEDISKYGIGALLSGGGGKPETNTPEGWRDMIGEFQNTARKSRLGIPLLYGVDANHGHANVPGATIFPHQIGLGATRNPELVEAIAQATTEEMRATGANWNFMPSLDVPEDIRWGRVFETFGTEPDVVRALGAAYIRGTQYTTTDGVQAAVATPKHFLATGSMEWGTSQNPEYKIDQGHITPDETLLISSYLPPYEMAVKEQAGGIMTSLGRWGQLQITGNRYLLNEMLKNKLGFKGFLVSDWYGAYNLPGGKYQAAVTALNAGIDMVMLPFEYKRFVRDVEKAVRSGDISPERLDDAVGRILTSKFELGLFEDATLHEALAVIGSAEHRSLARAAVVRSQVLLKNENVLPLQNPARIVVAGSGADNTGMQAGGWTIEWQGVTGNVIPGATSILKGLTARAPQGTDIIYNASGTFPEGIRAEVGIAVVGEQPYAEGYGDNAEPTLSADDRVAIENLRKISDKVIVIILSGRPLLVTNDISTWDALIAAWLPGSEGAGIADTLFGVEPFTGTLPLPWPLHKKDLDAETPNLLFPLGFGLTTEKISP